PRLTSKHAYLKLLRTHEVCIATSGLHGSSGWKFAEYMAAGRAIVSEPLRHRIPGTFSPGSEYLSFEGVDDCVAAVARLLGDRALRESCMHAARRYFDEYVSPPVMVRRALGIAGVL